VQVTDVNEDLGPYFGVSPGEGVLVTDVSEGSLGEKLGIKAGDVITDVDGKKTGSADDLREAVSDLDKGDEFTLGVIRSKKNLKLSGEMEEESFRMPGVEPHRFDVRVPKMDVRRFTDTEMQELRKEMKNLRKELDHLRQELDRMRESS